MKLLFDFFPIILFFLSYYQASFLIENTFVGQLINPDKPDFINATIIATAVAIIASFIQVGYNWFSTRKIERMHVFSLVLITVLGSITIFLGNPAFIQWKPTVLNWLFAIVFLGSMRFGTKPIVQRMMNEHIELPENVWKKTQPVMGRVLFYQWRSKSLRCFLLQHQCARCRANGHLG